MTKTVFWSWQSDLDGRVTRELIRSALDQAIGMLAADLDEAERPSLTSDTQGVAGTPDIVATILRKIDEAAVFVADVTPIAVSVEGSPVPIRTCSSSWAMRTGRSARTASCRSGIPRSTGRLSTSCRSTCAGGEGRSRFTCPPVPIAKNFGASARISPSGLPTI